MLVLTEVFNRIRFNAIWRTNARLGQVAIMVEESGDAISFDAARWVGWWLDQPIPALGGARPSEFVGILTGQKLLSEVLRQSQACPYRLNFDQVYRLKFDQA